MDRSTIYTSEQGRSTDILFAQRSAMIGLSKLAAAMLGTNTMVNGLGVAPTAPASMSVAVSPGEIYEVALVDATAYGALAADATHSILKQGLLMDAVNLSCPAPTTAGYSINYLIQATYQDQDTTNVVLPYFNSANPSQPLSGQSNSGVAQATQRQGVCVVTAKAGAAATTGTQTTPSPDSNNVGIKVVTVAYGASTIIGGNITAYAAAPFIPTDGLLRSIQNGEMQYAIDTSATANVITAAISPAPLSLVDGMTVKVVPAITNTGAVTFSLNGLTTHPAVNYSGAFTGGELIAGKPYTFTYNLASTSWYVTSSAGGITQSAADLRYALLTAFTTGQVKTTTAGNQPLSGGLVLKTGYITSVAAGATMTVTFPAAFPSAIMFGNIIPTQDSNVAQATPTITGATAAGFTSINRTTITNNFFWFAIGY